MWATRHSNVNLDYFKTLILQEISRSQNQHQVDCYAFSEVQHFVPISWTCKKQTSVSRSSTEAEVISLDAGLRMDRIPAHTLWDLVIEIFHSAPSNIKQPKRSYGDTRCKLPSQTCTTSLNANTPTSFQLTLTTFHPTQYILVLVPCCMSLKTMRP